MKVDDQKIGTEVMDSDAHKNNVVSRQNSNLASTATTKPCPFCGEEVKSEAKKCKHCGEILDVALRAVEDFKRSSQQNQPMVFMNAGGGGAAVSSPSDASGAGVVVGTKSKTTAIIIALFLGGIGIHKFYLGQTMQGILYLAFCWTGIPVLASIFDVISYMMMSAHQFKMNYG